MSTTDDDARTAWFSRLRYRSRPRSRSQVLAAAREAAERARRVLLLLDRAAPELESADGRLAELLQLVIQDLAAVEPLLRTAVGPDVGPAVGPVTEPVADAARTATGAPALAPAEAAPPVVPDERALPLIRTLIDLMDHAASLARDPDPQRARAVARWIEERTGPIFADLAVEVLTETGRADPSRHEVIGVTPAPEPSLVDTIDETIRPGYRWRGILLRPQQVTIRGAAPATTSERSEL